MNTARELINNFLAEFGKQLDTELALDANGICIIQVYDGINLAFELLEDQEDGDRICLRSPLVSISGRHNLEDFFRHLLLYNFVLHTRTGAVLVHAGDQPRIDAVLNFAPDFLNDQSFFNLVVGFLRAVEEAGPFVCAHLEATTRGGGAPAAGPEMIIRG